MNLSNGNISMEKKLVNCPSSNKTGTSPVNRYITSLWIAKYHNWNARETYAAIKKEHQDVLRNEILNCKTFIHLKSEFTVC